MRGTLATAALALGLALLGPRAALAADLTVFAAASLKNALDEIAGDFAEDTGRAATVSYAGSSALARQIQHGAPADIFISANPDWMDALERDSLIDAQSRFDLLGNAIVLIGHGADAPSLEIGSDLDLGALVDGSRLAMALVDAVPAGVYGKAALQSLGLWRAVAPRVVQADNVRAALALVAAGEAAAGIVYATDAAAGANVAVIGTFADGLHPPIVYPAAAVAGGEPLAADFLDYLRGERARRTFEGEGFAVLAE